MRGGAKVNYLIKKVYFLLLLCSVCVEGFQKQRQEQETDVSSTRLSH